MLRVNELKAGSVLSYISIFVTILVGLLYTPIMLRLLGQAEYGLYSLIGSLAAYLTILDLGLGNAIVRYNARNRAIGDKAAEASLNGMFLVLYSFIGLVTLIIGAILYLNLGNMFGPSLSALELGKARIMMALLVFNFTVSFPLGIFGSLVQAYEKFIFIKVLAIIRSILGPCIMLPFLYMGFGAVPMVVINTSLNILLLLINMIYAIRVLNARLSLKGFDYPLLAEIAGYSFFIFLGIIVDKVYWSTGQFILGIVSGTVVVAIYSIAIQLSTMYMMFSTAISGVLLPKVTMMVAKDASSTDLSDLMIKIGRIQHVVMAYIISGFILFGYAFIIIWAGANYSEAYYMALLLMIPITVPLIQNVGIAILQAQNRMAFRSWLYLAIAVVNVLVSIPLARIMGGLGCAIATGASLLIGNVFIINICYHRKIGLNIRLFWRNIAVMTLPVAGAFLCGYIINSAITQNSIAMVALKILIYSVIYVLVMWFFGINAYERELFASPARKMAGIFGRSQLGVRVND